ncbi:MAG: hypothetical protein AAFN48_09860, partial [Pseudomonadota bacterium]
ALSDYAVIGEGADTVDLGEGDDRFAGLSQDESVDRLTGGAGRDTYFFLTSTLAQSAVADVITDFAVGDLGDVIVFSQGQPNPFQGGQMALSQVDADTHIVSRAEDGSEQILLMLEGVDKDSLTSANFGGVTLSADNALILSDTDAGNAITGSAFNDIVFGNGGADTVDGLAGEDRLSGGLGDDAIDGGFGNDQIAGDGGNDTLIGGEGSDIISGGTGDDVLIGFGGSSASSDRDVLSGGLGDDRLEGGTGEDTYLFELGDGRDVITDLGGADRIELGAGIDPAAVFIAQVDGSHVELRIGDENGSGGRILIEDALISPETAIETLAFADGSEITWTDILALSQAGTAGDDDLRLPGLDRITNGGFEANGDGSYITIDGWVDLTGNRIQIIDGVAEGIGPNEGRRWLDLEGPDGNNWIEQTVTGLIGGSQLLLEFDHANRTSADSGAFEVYWNGDLVLTIAQDNDDYITQTLDLVAVDGDNTLSFRQLGSVNTDGVSLDNVRLYDAATAQGGTLNGGAGNDNLTGGDFDDDLTGGTGNDVLAGGLGDDTYRFAAGDGQDVIDDEAGANRLVLGVGIDPTMIEAVPGQANLVLRILGSEDRIDLGTPARAGMGVGIVEFADGTVWGEAELIALADAAIAGSGLIIGDEAANTLIGSAEDEILQGLEEADTLDGAGGNDRLEGGLGNDIYRFARTSGRDRIADEGGADTLEFAADITPDDVAVEQSSDGTVFVLRVRGTDARIAIEDALGTGAVEEIRFADGTIWGSQELIARAGTFSGDVITGDAADNTLEGGLGSDTL